MEETFGSKEAPNYWRIGEAIAECYLQDFQSIRIHHPISRDLKNPKASPQGADIVGFADMEGETVFVFGEIKTSSDKNVPPGVFYGPTGMKPQLENLKSNKEARSALIKYLGHKVAKLDEKHRFRIDFRSALKSWTVSFGTNVRIVGMLIRDILPDEKDLVARFNELVRDINAKMHLDLFAIYIPISIDLLSSSLVGS